MATPRTPSLLALRPRNSPSLAVLQQKKSVGSSILVLSPSKTLSTPSAVSAENKENAGSQTDAVQTTEAGSQTDISTLSPARPVTARDLEAEQPDANYYKALWEAYDQQIEVMLQRRLLLEEEAQETLDELNKTREALDLLKEVAADIAAEEAASSSSEDAT